MKRTNLNIILIVLIFVSFTSGIFVGISTQKVRSSAEFSGLVSSLNAKTVSTIVAYGIIESISGSKITLSYDGDKVVIFMNEDAQYTKLVPSTVVSKSKVEKSSLKELSVGDKVNITLKIGKNGEFMGTGCFVSK